MNFSWLSPGCLMTFSWLTYDFFMTISWLCHVFFMTFHDSIMTFSWLSHDFLMNIILLSHEFHITCSWLSHDILMTFSWESSYMNRPRFVPYRPLDHKLSTVLVTKLIFLCTPLTFKGCGLEKLLSSRQPQSSVKMTMIPVSTGLVLENVTRTQDTCLCSARSPAKHVQVGLS